jgi:TolB protein
MMTMRGWWAVAATLVPLLASGQAATIEVGAPNFRPLPFAVAPPSADPTTRAAADEIAQVVSADLRISGLFQVLDPRSFLAPAGEGHTTEVIAFPRWRDVGAEGLLKGDVRSAPDGVAGEFRVFDVAAGRELFGRVINGPPRSVGHLLADEIVRYYTGERGVFGTRIAAVRQGRNGRDLVLYDVDGKSAQVIYQEQYALLPAWRPDGGAIAFTSYRSGRPEIWTIDLATRTPRRLVAVGELSTGAAWSPDGARVAFAASTGGNSDVYVVNADGSNLVRLTRDPANDSSPTWSPDGRRIAFVSSRSGNPHIYVMNADGSDQRRLTFKGNYNQIPRWSPRGDLIAFTARDERKAFDIFLIAPDTGKVTRVTQGQGATNEAPTWAPNGRLLAFVSDRGGRSQIVVSTVDGSQQTIVTTDSGDVKMPAWGPLR